MGLLSSMKQNVFFVVNSFEHQKCVRLSKNYLIESKYRRVYFYHIRKCGGTSLNYMFLASGGRNGAENYKILTRRNDHRLIIDDRVFVGWNKKLIEDGHYFYAFSHMPQHKFQLPPDTFTITGFRDPVERILSHYKMILEMKKYNIRHPALKQEKRWVKKSFTDFLRKIPREHLLNEIYMFSRSFNVDEAFENIIKCSFVYFVDTFAEDMAKLFGCLQFDSPIQHIRKGSLLFEIEPMERLELQRVVQPAVALVKRLKAYQKERNKY